MLTPVGLLRFGSAHEEVAGDDDELLRNTMLETHTTLNQNILGDMPLDSVIDWLMAGKDIPGIRVGDNPQKNMAWVCRGLFASCSPLPIFFNYYCLS